MLSSLGRTVIVSPHLDDAVFGCGSLIAAHPGATVVTVFAGVPPHGAAASDWDHRRCGFASATRAVTRRREEDRVALSLLEARPAWRDFLAPARPDLRRVLYEDALYRGLRGFGPGGHDDTDAPERCWISEAPEDAHA
jgi:LmbE family N-acetylglucosaminyl deacetylase